MQHGAAQREALLPAAGKFCGEAVHVRREAVELDDFFDAALHARGLEAVDAPVELKIFRDGEVVVETEFLGHVADALADRFGIGAHVEAFDPRGAFAERQQTGEHLDDGGLAAAVGAEKAEDFAFLHAEADVIDGGEIAEAAHQMFRGDGRACRRLAGCEA